MKITHLYKVYSIIICLFILSCEFTEPNPIHGSWVDNKGNEFTFFNDNTFIAKTNSGVINYEGNYTILLNAITLTCTNIELRVVSEWDIRGNMLYLIWTDEIGRSSSLTLYKISN